MQYQHFQANIYFWNNLIVNYNYLFIAKCILNNVWYVIAGSRNRDSDRDLRQQEQLNAQTERDLQQLEERERDIQKLEVGGV